MIDLTALNAAVAANVQEAADTKGAEDSAVVVINGIGARVIEAVTANESSNAAMVAVVTDAVNSVTSAYTASRAPLAAALLNNPTP